LPSHVYCHPQNLRPGGIRDILRRLCGAENTEREKLSGRQKSTGEIPSRRGEIVAIVITIDLDFIGIIIFITIVTDTFIFIITTLIRPKCIYNFLCSMLVFTPFA
jgi:hypothetical protein